MSNPWEPFSAEAMRYFMACHAEMVQDRAAGKISIEINYCDGADNVWIRGRRFQLRPKNGDPDRK